MMSEAVPEHGKVVYCLHITGVTPLWQIENFTYITPGTTWLGGPYYPVTDEQKKQLTNAYVGQPGLMSELNNPAYNVVIIFHISIDDESHYGSWGRKLS